MAKEMRQLKQTGGGGTAKKQSDYDKIEGDEGQKFITWEQVMQALRDPNMPDQQSADEVKEWYRGVLTSTKKDRQGKGIDYADNFGWTMLFMATYYDKPITILELLMLGADPSLRLTATKRSSLDVAEQEHRESAALVLRTYFGVASEDFEGTGMAKLKQWHADKKELKELCKNFVHTVGDEQVGENPGAKKALSKKAAEQAKKLAAFGDSFEANVERLFKKYDADGSGRIDAHEVRDIFHEMKIKLSEEDVEAMVVQYDEDQSGELDLEEFTNLAREADMGDQAFVERIKETFKMADADGSGTIDVEELVQAFKQLDLDLTREETEALIEQYDVDGGGELSEDEFIQLTRDAKEGFMATADEAKVAGLPWGKQEETLFQRGMKLHGENWRKVRQVVGTRSAVQCRAYYKVKEKELAAKSGGGEGDAEKEQDEYDKRIEAIERARMTKKQLDSEAAAMRAHAEHEAKVHDEERRVLRRSTNLHEAMLAAQEKVYGKEFDPGIISSWETEQGFRTYLRQYNVNRGTNRPCSPKTRERLRKVFKKDKDDYYKKMKSLREAFDANVNDPKFLGDLAYKEKYITHKGMKYKEGDEHPVIATKLTVEQSYEMLNENAEAIGFCYDAKKMRTAKKDGCIVRGTGAVMVADENWTTVVHNHGGPPMGIEPAGPIGKLSSEEVIDVIVQYGGMQGNDMDGHPAFQKFWMPGKKYHKGKVKQADPWGEQWTKDAVKHAHLTIKGLRRKEFEEAQANQANNLFGDEGNG